MTEALQEIIDVFDKWNVSVNLVLPDGHYPQLDFIYEDEEGIVHELDGFWEDRIKAYSLGR